jgi:hypothetical protein
MESPSFLCTDACLPFFFAFFFLIYRGVEKTLGHIQIVPYLLKLCAVAVGLYFIIMGCSHSYVGTSVRKHGANIESEGLGSVLIIILGVAIMTLPLYSRYVKFRKEN